MVMPINLEPIVVRKQMPFQAPPQPEPSFAPPNMPLLDIIRMAQQFPPAPVAPTQPQPIMPSIPSGVPMPTSAPSVETGKSPEKKKGSIPQEYLKYIPALIALGAGMASKNMLPGAAGFMGGYAGGLEKQEEIKREQEKLKKEEKLKERELDIKEQIANRSRMVRFFDENGDEIASKEVGPKDIIRTPGMSDKEYLEKILGVIGAATPKMPQEQVQNVQGGGERIRVRKKSNGQIGNILPQDFNESIYERL